MAKKQFAITKNDHQAYFSGWDKSNYFGEEFIYCSWSRDIKDAIIYSTKIKANTDFKKIKKTVKVEAIVTELVNMQIDLDDSSVDVIKGVCNTEGLSPEGAIIFSLTEIIKSPNTLETIK